LHALTLRKLLLCPTLPAPWLAEPSARSSFVGGEAAPPEGKEVGESLSGEDWRIRLEGWRFGEGGACRDIIPASVCTAAATRGEVRRRLSTVRSGAVSRLTRAITQRSNGPGLGRWSVWSVVGRRLAPGDGPAAIAVAVAVAGKIRKSMRLGQRVPSCKLSPLGHTLIESMPFSISLEK